MSRKGADHLYLTDELIAGKLGVSVEKWRANAKALEQSGLPLRDPLFCNRRYWPAVRAFLDRRNGIGAPSQSQSSYRGEEHWDGI